MDYAIISPTVESSNKLLDLLELHGFDPRAYNTVAYVSDWPIVIINMKSRSIVNLIGRRRNGMISAVRYCRECYPEIPRITIDKFTQLINLEVERSEDD